MLQLECQNNINAVDNSHIQHKSARMFCRSYCLTYRAIEFGMRVLLPVQPSPSVPKICWHLLHTPRAWQTATKLCTMTLVYTRSRVLRTISQQGGWLFPFFEFFPSSSFLPPPSTPCLYSLTLIFPITHLIPSAFPFPFPLSSFLPSYREAATLNPAARVWRAL